MPNSSASISVSTSAAQLIATKGTLPAAAQLVNLPRDQLLAGPALAFDQDGEIRGRHRSTRSRRPCITRLEPMSGAAPSPAARAPAIVPARESFGLENQRGEACRRFEQLTTPVVDAAVTGKRRFEHQAWRGVLESSRRHSRASEQAGRREWATCQAAR